MRICEECGKEFDTFQAKANHVRWNHKKENFSKEGLERIRQSNIRTANKLYGEKIFVTITKKCECGNEFTETFISNRKHTNKRYCSRSCATKFSLTEDSKNKIREWHKSHPENYENFRMLGMNSNNTRYSSKAERLLYDALSLEKNDFKRHFVVRSQNMKFDVDIVSNDKKVWIESDGIWHFKQVHKGHNFELTQLRDKIEEIEAIKQNVLLIRVNNQVTSIEQQKDFILNSISSWNRTTGKILKLGFDSSQFEVS